MTDEITVNVEIPDTQDEIIPVGEVMEVENSPEITQAILDRLENIEIRKRFEEILAKLEAAQNEIKMEVIEIRSDLTNFKGILDDFMLAQVIEQEPIDEAEDTIIEEAPILPEVEIIPAEPTDEEKKAEEPTKRKRFFI